MSEKTTDVLSTRLGDVPVWLVVLVAVVVLVALPMALGAFWTRIGLGALMWIGLAQSWNMIGGYAGYLDFGHGAYFGIGAFATGAVMVTFGLPFLAGFVVAAAVAAVIAYLVAVPTLRLTGAYFAIATWALAEAFKQLALNLDITGGTFGLSLPTAAGSFGLPVGELSTSLFYYLMLALCLATIAVTYVVFERSEFGFRVKALRDDEDAAESLGIDTTRVKRQVYVLSCAIAALFGSVHAYFITFIHPNDVLAAIITDQMVIMALLGGLGTITGPIIGGILVFLLQRLSSVFLGQSTIYLPLIGVLIMIVVLFAPSGVVGILRGEVDRTDIRNNARELAEKFDLL
ncbi:branched-chain amino acid ABC transporter permease [Salinigranum rubrum]|uniref:Branched-chain amino acid ABC transporter permease n=1 Tax=Salinigranum rubrum TaxID=755307 RepID=A0A2I8VPL6_9EURY|nr:branched-chain amino acid ABC transporter permease [Salinigranum rubrum]AUV83867.1 branched-chain amino acid ABC transporter permease [Salinigranum rubrum]